MTMTDKKCGGLRATYDDVLNAPETKVAELIDGVLYLSPISECLVNFSDRQRSLVMSVVLS